MGTEYQLVCHDCRRYVELDKMGDRTWVLDVVEPPSAEDAERDAPGLTFRALRAVGFMAQHLDHRLQYTTEHSELYAEYEEVMHWPSRKCALQLWEEP